MREIINFIGNYLLWLEYRVGGWGNENNEGKIIRVFYDIFK